MTPAIAAATPGPLQPVAAWVIAAGAPTWSAVASNLGVSRQYIHQRLQLRPAADTRVGDAAWWAAVTDGDATVPDAWAGARARVAALMAGTYASRGDAIRSARTAEAWNKAKATRAAKTLPPTQDPEPT